MADTPPSPIALQSIFTLDTLRFKLCLNKHKSFALDEVEYFAGKKHVVQLGGIPPPLAERFCNIAFDRLPKVNKCMIMLKPGCKK